MDLDDNLRLSLLNLWHYTRFETIAGVEIDLRHPDIDPREWRTGTSWDNEYVDEIQFPWIDQKLAQEWRAWSRQIGLPPRLPRLVSVKAGDRVEVDRVVRRTDADPFSHQHDVEERDAYLLVRRRNGQVRRLSNPIVFRGTSRMTGPLPFDRVTFGRIALRICEHLEIEDITAYYVIGEEVDNADLALLSAQHVAQRKAELEQALLKPDPPELILLGQSRLSKLVNDAVALGYHWASAEADLRLRPHAERGLQWRSASPKGGIASGARRRLEAESTWRPHALELAIAARRKNPRFSQESVVSQIMLGWGDAPFPCPGFQTLKRAVSSWERDGRVQRRRI